jgi:hypothetical protein
MVGLLFDVVRRENNQAILFVGCVQVTVYGSGKLTYVIMYVKL